MPSPQQRTSYSGCAAASKLTRSPGSDLDAVGGRLASLFLAWYQLAVVAPATINGRRPPAASRVAKGSRLARRCPLVLVSGASKGEYGEYGRRRGLSRGWLLGLPGAMRIRSLGPGYRRTSYGGDSARGGPFRAVSRQGVT